MTSVPYRAFFPSFLCDPKRGWDEFHASHGRKKMFSFPFSGGTYVLLAKAQPCLLRKQNCTSGGRRKTENVFCFSVRDREARACLSRKHNRASSGSKTIPIAEGKKQKMRFFLHFQKARSCLLRKQNRASYGRKRTVFMIFFKFF